MVGESPTLGGGGGWVGTGDGGRGEGTGSPRDCPTQQNLVQFKYVGHLYSALVLATVQSAVNELGLTAPH